jgi:hypothetical protein
MIFSEYREAIFKARSIPFKATSSIMERQTVALEMAVARLNLLISEATNSLGQVDAVLYRVKRDNILALLETLAQNLSRDIHQGVLSVTEETTSLISEVTTDLVEDEDQGDIRFSFVTIPEEVLKDYAKRTDIEGLKFSPNIWAKRQMRNIEKQVLSAIMRGQSATSLSKDLVQYLKGGSVGMGHSIRYKTLRLARTEINTAFHETRRLGAVTSPVVAGMRWRLSNRHPMWDVCDLLAQQDLYHMGKGVYPPEQLPPKPHPNCICYTMDQLRDPKEWQTQKPVSTIKESPSNFKVKDAKGTDRYVKKQYRIFTALLDRVVADAKLETDVDPQ